MGAVEVAGKKTIKSLNTLKDMEIMIDDSYLQANYSLPKITTANIEVIYEDEDILVIDKPADIASHASFGWDGADVITSLISLGYSISTSGPQERKGVVHRLDVGTSGVMIVAKSEFAYSALKDCFRNRAIKKIYHTLIQGMPDPLQGTIDAPIGRHPNHDWKFSVLKGGRNSLTHYKLLEAFGRASLCEVKPETGRTHQIRVHFSALKHPCVGDPLYGADKKMSKMLGLNHQWLHAYKIEFLHPRTRNKVSFISKYPEYLNRSLNLLRNF